MLRSASMGEDAGLLRELLFRGEGSRMTLARRRRAIAESMAHFLVPQTALALLESPEWRDVLLSMA
jgi:hypothetical protein